MYSPADRPSSIRAAPAKNRIWSTIGGISSAMVRATGLPVFWLSAPHQLLGARFDGVGDPEEGQAPLRRGGALPAGEGLGGAPYRPVDVGGSGDRSLGERLAGGRVDQRNRRPVHRVDQLSADEVLHPPQ